MPFDTVGERKKINALGGGGEVRRPYSWKYGQEATHLIRGGRGVVHHQFISGKKGR